MGGNGKGVNSGKRKRGRYAEQKEDFPISETPYTDVFLIYLRYNTVGDFVFLEMGTAAFEGLAQDEKAEEDIKKSNSYYKLIMKSLKK